MEHQINNGFLKFNGLSNESSHHSHETSNRLSNESSKGFSSEHCMKRIIKKHEMDYQMKHCMRHQRDYQMNHQMDYQMNLQKDFQVNIAQNIKRT